MTSARPTRRDAALAATPALERLLGRLRARLATLAWMQGLGVVATLLVAWLAFSFVADWALHVPLGVRWMHLLVCVVAPLAALWRFALRPWLRRPDRAGLALLVERRRPDLHQLLVSAVQLQQSPPSDADPELVQRVLRSAELEAGRTSLDGVLDPRLPRRMAALGAAAAIAAVLAVRTWPDHASIFFDRLVGGATPWPQLTHLELALGARMEQAQIEDTPDGPLVRLPRGADAPIVVRARGAQPDEVRLHFGGAGSVTLTAGPDGAFRTVLRAMQEDVVLHATGGDDRDAEPKLSLVVLDPPDVAALAVTIEPPAYTALAPRVEFDRDVEVPLGSKLTIAVRPAPADAQGVARLLPADQTLPLVATTFPPGRVQGDEVDAGGPALGFEWLAEQSLRYRIELVDASGFANPDPGLFAVNVVRDERPQVELLAPGRHDLETLERGLVRLLVRAEDDFGVAELQWRARRTGADAAPAWTAMERSTSDAGAAPASDAPTWGVRAGAVLASARAEIASLGSAGQPLKAGDQLELEVRVLDARPALADGTPDPAGVSSPTPVRVRVVAEDDFLRRLQDRLARVRQQAAEIEPLARERSRRTGELLRAIESDEGSASASEMTGLVSGQRRVQGDLDSLAREFAGIVENVLYARLDETASGALADLDARLSQVSARSFPMQTWRDFAASMRTSQALASGVPAQLVRLMDLSLELAAVDSPKAVEALDRATREAHLTAVHAALTQAHEAQAQLEQRLARLLEELAEWDNFQAVLNLTRDILNRQKSIQDRTVEASGADPRSDKR